VSGCSYKSDYYVARCTSDPHEKRQRRKQILPGRLIVFLRFVSIAGKLTNFNEKLPLTNYVDNLDATRLT